MSEPKYTVDWFSHHINDWVEYLAPLKDKPNLRILEIGALEGRSTRWLFENIATHPTSRIMVVDPHITLGEFAGMDVAAIFANFNHNIESFKDRMDYIQKGSRDAEAELPRNFYDLVYVDGSHTAHDALHDCVIAFNCLKPNGVGIVDDYGYPFVEVIRAANAFAECYFPLIKFKQSPSYQFVFWKTPPP